MTFEVVKIEFEFCSDTETTSMQSAMDKFVKEAARYIPTIKDITKTGCEENKGILEFKRELSLNTICNILSQMNKKYSSFKIEELEYKPDDKTVEVEVE